MFQPSLEEFKKKAKKGNLIPVYREILADMETPVSAFQKIDDGRSGASAAESRSSGTGKLKSGPLSATRLR
jgi:hypothetical protein